MEKLGGNRFAGTIGTLLKGQPAEGNGFPWFLQRKIVRLKTITIIAKGGMIFASGGLPAPRSARAA
jgi:hypothetical protein